MLSKEIEREIKTFITSELDQAQAHLLACARECAGDHLTRGALLKCLYIGAKRFNEEEADDGADAIINDASYYGVLEIMRQALDIWEEHDKETPE